MNIMELQHWLNWRGAKLSADGLIGPATRGAFLAAFANTRAPAIAFSERQAIADDLGITPKQLNAIATVESRGGGFDVRGRPKILYERHIFHRLTNGAHSVALFSNPASGGYSHDSWDKLTQALGKDVDAAIMACSWGAFQVMGMHWAHLGYHSAIDMAHGMVVTERAHYEALSRFIRANGLTDAARRISANAETNRAFARGYNGSAYERRGYHRKLSEAMK